MLVDSWLLRAARSRPRGVALDTRAGSCSYAQLLAHAGVVATHLRDRDVRAGERVAIALPAGLDFAYALHACLLLGATAVPVDLRMSVSERARVTEGSALLIDRPLDISGCEEPTLDSSASSTPHGLQSSHDIDATAVMIHTSGTS
jgi:acyl-CoA synthetase (AMP-forming)/AMP-acid ligase II